MASNGDDHDGGGEEDSSSAVKSDPLPDLHQNSEVHDGTYLTRDIAATIDSLKKQLMSDRSIYIKKKIEDNRQSLYTTTQHVYSLTKARRNNSGNSNDVDSDLLARRQYEALCTVNSLELPGGEKDNISCQEEGSYASSTVLLGNTLGGKNGVRPIKLPEVQKIPPYTTWIFLDRNQRMAEDQSVVGRRRIYYDQTCGEALICSDSEDDMIEDEEDKKGFTSAEEYIIRMTIQQAGLNDAVLNSLSQCLEKNSDEIRARYEILQQRYKSEACLNDEVKAETKAEDAFLDKDLDAALDSFDNLFCRRCLVFDCRLHGCSQDLVFPAEKQLPWNNNSDDGTPCGVHCYKLAPKPESIHLSSEARLEEPSHSSHSAGAQLPLRKKMQVSLGKKVKSHQSESASSNARASESSESDLRTHENGTSAQISTSPSKAKMNGKYGMRKKTNKRVAERVLMCIRKKKKKVVQSDADSIASGSPLQRDLRLRSRNGNKSTDLSSVSKIIKSATIKKLNNKALLHQENTNFTNNEIQSDSGCQTAKETIATDDDENSEKKEIVDENSCKHENSNDKSWKAIEQSLYSKGLEIFGRNSCLISRNLLSGLKTCMEVFHHMHGSQSNGSYRVDGVGSLVEGAIDFNGTMGTELRTRSRFLRRRGRVRRLKYTWKSAGYHSIRKRISERKDQPCRQYNPCGCQSACGKQCPCLLNGTCCEKYCGCPKICKNRFRGCHCAKSQCRSRQCPCFAADRECDPDVCRNCWVGCGDGTLGGPNQRGDNYECRNMKLLLKQQQRVLLGRSDVSGWGAFLKNSVGKHEYLGEYTGELISHREADKRGKIYDRENSSFLFNLNDQFVLDAYRKGDKLKFANHSPDPNCYAKVIMVAGDHRVGIFAKERICAGEELFYDYRYEPDRAPAWARKPESSGSKKDESQPSIGRAKKLA